MVGEFVRSMLVADCGPLDPGGCVGQVVGGITNTVKFLDDPLGFMVAKTQAGVQVMVDHLLPWMLDHTMPDLTQSWFITAYRISFGAAVLFWLVILLGRILAAARGTASGTDLVDVFTVRAFTFVGGATFGPAAGWVLIQFFHALSGGFLHAMGTDAGTVQASLSGMVDTSVWTDNPNAAVFVLVVMLFLLLVMVVVIVMQVLALVGVYLAGAVWPLGLMWIADDPSRRRIAYRLTWAWIGLLASSPLMILLLGTTFGLVTSWATTTDPSGSGADSFAVTAVRGITSVVAMGMVAVSPGLLFKFAPVLPAGTGQSVPGLPGPGGGGQGSPQSTEQAANNQAASDASTPSDGQDPAAGGPGPLEQAVMSTPAGGGSTSSTPGAASTSGGGGLAADGDGPAGDGGVLPEAGAPPAGGGSVPLGATSTGVGGGELAGAGAAAGGGEAGLAAAGAAETATGVGAVVGVPTLLAAAGLQAAGKAKAAAGAAAGATAGMMDGEHIGSDR